MKRFIACLLICLFIASGAAGASFERVSLTPRSAALGGASAALADDPSTIFYNLAGMAMAGRFVYADYSQPACNGCRDEIRASATLPVRGVAIGAGWYFRGRGSGADERLFIVGAARRLLAGTQGSFLAVGGALRVGRVAGRVEIDGVEETVDQAVTGDAGVILRPLPVVSLAYAIENAVEPDVDFGDYDGRWRRIQHWGAALFWDNRVTVSFESRHSAGRATLHYGVAVRAEVPVELMVGFSDGSAYGGVRWVGRGPHGVVAFAAEGDGSASWSVSLEVPIGSEEGESP